MSSVTIWILLSMTMSYRPVVVIERFETDAYCQEARKAIENDLTAKCYRFTVLKQIKGE